MVPEPEKFRNFGLTRARQGKLFIKFFWTLAGISLLSSAASYGQKPTAAISAKSFVGSLGVNVHMEYTDGGYANVSEVLQDLNYLGISTVRDSVPDPVHWKPAGQGAAAIRALVAQGIKFDMIVAININVALNEIDSLEAVNHNALASIEGPNEINNWAFSYGGLTGDAAARMYQRQLYAAIRADKNLKNLPVYYFTGGHPTTPQGLSGLADFANGHPYPKNGDQPAGTMISEFATNYTNLGTFPKVLTETGYYTLPTSRNWGGVDYSTQAKALLNTYFDAATLGISQTFVYQLLDAYADPQSNNLDKHFGFFDYQNTAKPAAFALHNLTTFLADAKDSQGALSYVVSGLPSTVRSLLLSKSDRSFVLAIWNEIPFWNESREGPIQNSAIQGELCLQEATDLSSYDPLTAVSSSLGHHQTCAQINVPDHVILIRIAPTS